MALRSDARDWGAVAKLLHWGMAAGILGMVGLGLAMTRLDPAEAELKFRLFQLHKSIGVALLCLAGVRIAWRASAREVPTANPGTAVGERALAAATHWLLYACIVALPITGLLAASASPLGIPTVVFGAFELPRLLAPDAVVAERLGTAHALIAWTLSALVALHAAGALRHALVLRDGVLARMLPRQGPSKGSGGPDQGEWEHI